VEESTAAGDDAGMGLDATDTAVYDVGSGAWGGGFGVPSARHDEREANTA
jgi:hypothetical protein